MSADGQPSGTAPCRDDPAPRKPALLVLLPFAALIATPALVVLVRGAWGPRYVLSALTCGVAACGIAVWSLVWALAPRRPLLIEATAWATGATLVAVGVYGLACADEVRAAAYDGTPGSVGQGLFTLIAPFAAAVLLTSFGAGPAHARRKRSARSPEGLEGGSGPRSDGT